MKIKVKYLFYILLLHFKVVLLQFVQENRNANNNNNNNETLEIIEKWLQLPTKYISHINLMLRAEHFQKDAQDAYVHWFLNCKEFLITILTYDERSLRNQAPYSYVKDNRENFLIVTSLENLRIIAKYFVQKAGNFFYLIVDDEFDDNEISDIFTEIWLKYFAFKNYILTSKGIFIYDPFVFDAKQNNYGKIIPYFGEKEIDELLFKNMRGYPLKVQIFRSVYSRPKLYKGTKKISFVDGVDGQVAYLLQERMNFSMNLQEPNPDYFGERSPNGSYNGAIGSIIKNEIDMCLTGFFVKDYMVPEMDFSVAVYDDQLCIYVAKAQRIPQSILPLFSVSHEIWFGYILTAFACATIWWILRYLNLRWKILHINDPNVEKTYAHQIVRIYIDTWVLWVRVNVLRYPPFHSERIFIATLFLVSVIFGAIFESSLASIYIHPMYYKDINTMRELDETGFNVIYKYSSMADDLFFSETSPLFASLNKKLKHLNNLNADVTLDITKNGGKAGVSRYLTLTLESFHFIISKKLWIIPECPKYYAISYVFPKDSPWERTINKFLLQFLAAGLIEKWRKDMQTQVDINIMKRQLFETVDTFKILTINDLQLAFYVVLLGSLMGVISLVFEKILSYYKCKKKKTKITIGN